MHKRNDQFIVQPLMWPVFMLMFQVDLRSMVESVLTKEDHAAG